VVEHDVLPDHESDELPRPARGDDDVGGVGGARRSHEGESHGGVLLEEVVVDGGDVHRVGDFLVLVADQDQEGLGFLARFCVVVFPGEHAEGQVGGVDGDYDLM
jgi:hypothetical protein